MANPQKAKGDRAELRAAELLSQKLGIRVRRKLGAGRADDVGDLDGVPDTVVQVKHYNDLARAVINGVDDAERNQGHARARFGLALVRMPRRPRWFVVMSVEQLVELLEEAIPEELAKLRAERALELEEEQ